MEPLREPLETLVSPTVSGKQRLIDAALRLAAREGTALSALGLRELAREAGLNHNTFYRHFIDLEDLGRAATEAVATQLLAGMKAIRRDAARHADATVGVADYFLDFACAHPDLIVVGLRELHGSDTPMRRVLRRTLDDIAQENVEQIRDMQLVPDLPRSTLLQACAAITYYMVYRALDCIERPAQRASIHADIVSFIRSQFLGRLALQRAGHDAAARISGASLSF